MIRQLFAGCWPFGHGNRLWVRDDTGVMRHRCEDCGHDRPILASAIVKDGPKAEPEEVRGAPTETKVKIHAERSKISFALRSRRS